MADHILEMAGLMLFCNCKLFPGLSDLDCINCNPQDASFNFFMFDFFFILENNLKVFVGFGFLNFESINLIFTGQESSEGQKKKKMKRT